MQASSIRYRLSGTYQRVQTWSHPLPLQVQALNWTSGQRILFHLSRLPMISLFQTRTRKGLKLRVKTVIRSWYSNSTISSFRFLMTYLSDRFSKQRMKPRAAMTKEIRHRTKTPLPRVFASTYKNLAQVLASQTRQNRTIRPCKHSNRNSSVMRRILETVKRLTLGTLPQPLKMQRSPMPMTCTISLRHQLGGSSSCSGLILTGKASQAAYVNEPYRLHSVTLNQHLKRRVAVENLYTKRSP